MKNGLGKRLTAIALGLMLTCAPLPSFAAEQQTDYRGHWAEHHIRTWLDNGMLQDDENGSIDPDEAVTRVEFMSLVNQSFGIAESLDIPVIEYPKAGDVAPDDPAYETVSIALAAGYIRGDQEGSVHPLDPLTREQAAVILARLLKLDGSGSEDALERFRDAADIAGWSRPAVASVLSKGLFVGFNDATFRPGSLLTRAESIVILDRALQQRYAAVYDEAGTYGPEAGTQTLEGDVLIDTPGVTLRNMVITGNLTIGEGVGEGDAVIDSVFIGGDTFVKGGGVNSIYFRDAVTVNIVINKKTGEVRFVAEGNTKVNEVNVQSSARIDSSKAAGGGIANVTLADRLPSGSKVLLLGSFDNVNVNAGAVDVDVPGGSIKNLNVSSKVDSASLNLGADAKISNLVLNAALKVTGQGTIEKATIEQGAEGTTFDKPPADVTGEWIPPVLEPAPNPAPTPSPSPSPSPSPDPADPPTDPADPPTDPADPPTDPADPPAVVQLVYGADVRLFIGDSLQLTLQAELSDDTLVDVTKEATGWSSSDESVATVDATGRVTAVGVGSAAITATYGGLTAEYAVTVTELADVKVTYAVLAVDDKGSDFVSVDLDDGVIILTDAADTRPYLFVLLEHLNVVDDETTLSGMPGATLTGKLFEYLSIRLGPVEAGNEYELIISGLKKAGPPVEDMGTFKIRIRR